MTLTEAKRLKGSDRVRFVQRRIKEITKKSKIPLIDPGPTDGIKGKQTQLAIKQMKKAFGVQSRNANISLGNGFIEHLHDPWNRKWFSAPGQWARGLKFRESLRAENKKRIKAQKSGTVGERALKAAGTKLGKQETSNNDAPWLREMEADILRAGGDLAGLGWMIPGNPYCGMGVIWSYLEAGVKLPAGFVYTPNIRGYANRTINGVRFTLVAPEKAKPGDAVVFDWSPGSGADHVALAKGAMRNGVIATREFNTSPTNAGSQSNGGGVYDRTRPRAFIQCVVRITKA